MRTDRSRRGSIAYAIFVLGLASGAFLPENPNTAVYSLLLLVSFPASLLLAGMYIPFGLLLMDYDSVWVRLIVIGLWTAVAFAQTFAFREIARSFRPGPPKVGPGKLQ
jgi:hypothetical protein